MSLIVVVSVILGVWWEVGTHQVAVLLEVRHVIVMVTSSGAREVVLVEIHLVHIAVGLPLWEWKDTW